MTTLLKIVCTVVRTTLTEKKSPSKVFFVNNRKRSLFNLSLLNSSPVKN